MGPISSAVLVAALTVLRVLFWIVAVLLLVLVAVQAVRQDPGAQPAAHAGAAAALGAAGWIFGRIAAVVSSRRG